MFKLRFIFGIIPVLLIKTNFLIFSGTAATSLGFVIFIRPRAWNNEALIAHELTHSKQMWRYLIIGYILAWVLSKKMRLKFEVEAYKVQLTYYEGDEYEAMLNRFAHSMSKYWYLDVSYEKAKELLEK